MCRYNAETTADGVLTRTRITTGYVTAHPSHSTGIYAGTFVGLLFDRFQEQTILCRNRVGVFRLSTKKTVRKKGLHHLTLILQ